jgi:hypothetical protein
MWRRRGIRSSEFLGKAYIESVPRVNLLARLIRHLQVSTYGEKE